MKNAASAGAPRVPVPVPQGTPSAVVEPKHSKRHACSALKHTAGYALSAAAGAGVTLCACLAALYVGSCEDRKQYIGLELSKDDAPVGGADALVEAYIPEGQREEVAAILQAGYGAFALAAEENPDLLGRIIPYAELVELFTKEALETAIIMQQIQTRCPLDWRLGREELLAQAVRVTNGNKKVLKRFGGKDLRNAKQKKNFKGGH